MVIIVHVDPCLASTTTEGRDPSDLSASSSSWTTSRSLGGFAVFTKNLACHRPFPGQGVVGSASEAWSTNLHHTVDLDLPVWRPLERSRATMELMIKTARVTKE
jgi:hypothetical protein